MKVTKEVLLAEMVKKYGSFSSFASVEFGYKPVEAKRKGREVGCVCPHHTSASNDRGENCSINEDKMSFNCFSCGTGGSPLDMVMQERNLDFPEACKWLAEKLGIQGDTTVEKTDVSIRRKFASICHQNLMAIKDPASDPERAKKLAPYKEEYENAFRYLGERGFIIPSIKFFGIGYCGQKGLEIEEMFSLGYSVKDLMMADIMMKSNKTGKHFVPLKGRVTTMASRNIYGRKVVVEPGNEQYKHYYSRSKQQIWNLNSCANKEREIVFVVEAIFDGIAIHQYINRLQKNWAVVATCGTGGIRKEDLVEIIKKTNPQTVMIVPDSDEFFKNGKRHAVGQKKGLEKAYAFEEAGQNTRIVVLPNGKDPCDLAKDRVGASKFEEMVKKALYPVRYEIFLEAHFNKRKSYDQKQEFLNGCKKILGKHKVSLREDMLDWIALLIKVNKEEVRDFFTSSFAKADVLDYFKKCYKHGMTDEQIIAHLKTLM